MASAELGPGEKLFSIINNVQGPILATLDGYAIVPIGHLLLSHWIRATRNTASISG